MAKEYKYYTALTIIQGEKLTKLKELGYTGTHAQFSIVCKAKSIAEANRITELYGLGKCFKYKYKGETVNEKDIELADRYGLIICVGGAVSGEYIDIKSVV